MDLKLPDITASLDWTVHKKHINKHILLSKILPDKWNHKTGH